MQNATHFDRGQPLLCPSHDTDIAERGARAENESRLVLATGNQYT